MPARPSAATQKYFSPRRQEREEESNATISLALFARDISPSGFGICGIFAGNACQKNKMLRLCSAEGRGGSGDRRVGSQPTREGRGSPDRLCHSCGSRNPDSSSHGAMKAQRPETGGRRLSGGQQPATDYRLRTTDYILSAAEFPW